MLRKAKAGHPKHTLPDEILGDGTTKLQNDDRYYLRSYLVPKLTQVQIWGPDSKTFTGAFV